MRYCRICKKPIRGKEFCRPCWRAYCETYSDWNNKDKMFEKVYKEIFDKITSKKMIKIKVVK